MRESGICLMVERDTRLAARRRIEIILPVLFFVVAVSLFPFGVGPEPKTLRLIAPGIVWVCALLATMLSVGTLYSSDHADGTLEQMLLSSRSLVTLVIGRSIAHWLISGLPLILLAPFMALLFGMTELSTSVLALGLLLGTPALSLLGSIGAALTLGLRNGSVLVFLLVLPLCIPVLIFGVGAVIAADAGLPPDGHLSLLAALLLLCLLGAPVATAAALKISIH